MTAATYQYVDLPDASVVTTRALLAARENIADRVAARAMMCIHGGAGFGKILAVNTCLRALEPGEDVRKITFRAGPRPVRCATNCSPRSTWPATRRAAPASSTAC
ncbi:MULTISPECIES: hypothetical protein [Actinomycetes]|uniref:Uncharacterized protein n=1 Tax=Streptomyces tendae TaxID=1932 RepID=A0A6B3QP33_STRTE|nr:MULTISPECIES: hypothetical protein [Streptomyces]MZG15471.1 hypothetical protein [Streptomyces sp. SID5914]NEV89879.1 hypothetical protein [Streptomyces tendae]BET45207.1 hypothetical protein RGQ21_01890 [Kitasatospora aureofaciens]